MLRRNVVATLAVATMVALCHATCHLNHTTATVECRNPASIGEIESFFQKDFATKDFEEFCLHIGEDRILGPLISHSPSRIILSDVFYGASFKKITLRGPGALFDVTNDAFISSKETLEVVQILDTWPGRLHLGNLLGWQTYHLTVSPLPPSAVLNCAGHDTSSLKIYVEGDIDVLSSGFWKYCSSAYSEFEVSGSLRGIEGGAFTVGDKRNATLCLDLMGVGLRYIRPDFINTQDLREDAWCKIQLLLDVNDITEIPENVFRKYFDMENVQMTLDISDNPLSCGCGFAWLTAGGYGGWVAEGATCEDGRHLADLTPEDFLGCSQPQYSDIRTTFFSL